MGWSGDVYDRDYWWQNTQISTVLLALLPVWLLGACIGLLVSQSFRVLHAVADSGLAPLTSLSACTQLPRPRWLETSSRVGAFWLASPSGVLFRRFTLAVQGAVIARQVPVLCHTHAWAITAVSCTNYLLTNLLILAYREVWRHYAVPGTFHAIAAAMWGLLRGDGFALQLPEMPSHVKELITDSPQKATSADASAAAVDIADWYVAPVQ